MLRIGNARNVALSPFVRHCQAQHASWTAKGASCGTAKMYQRGFHTALPPKGCIASRNSSGR
jgi:hypothetical protein